MIRILFVCHGNICRSPMAEYIMKKIVRDNNEANNYYIESAATTSEEIGNDIYYLAKEKMLEKNIPFEKRKARKVNKSDYEKFDYIICMDDENVQDLNYIFNLNFNTPNDKIKKLKEFNNDNSDISDPWYTRNFEKTYNEIYQGILVLFNQLKE